MPGHERRCPSLLRNNEGLVILGVIHQDKDGPGLLDSWLEAIEPHVITLEFSNYGMEFRRELGPGYKRRIEEVGKRLKKRNLPCYDNALSMALSYVEMPYEFDRASEYGRAHGVPVYLVDMDFFSYIRLRESEKFLDAGNLEKILSDDRRGGDGNEKTLARLFFEEGLKTAAYTDEMLVRDRYMSNRIAILRKYYRGKRFVHISGWRHLEDPYDVYGFLNPLKVFIYDKTLCI